MKFIRRSLYWKLTLAFMLVSFTTAVLVGVFIRLTSVNRLSQLIIEQQRSSLQQSLSSYYAANGSWDSVETNWQQIIVPAPMVVVTPSGGNHPPENNLPWEAGRRNPLGLADAQGVVIVSFDRDYPVGSTLSSSVLKRGAAVMVNGRQVGTILTASQPSGFTTQETLFLQRTSEALLGAVGVALVVALAMGILLSRTLTRPLQALNQGVQKMTQGEVSVQVEVTSEDEIGKLAVAFNQMSREVARVNQQRRQMTADIAHDLRTPLTVIAGYIESMQDGVLAPTPQRLALIYAEISRMQNLVGDLRMLSQVDAGELPLSPQKISPKPLLERSANLFYNQAKQQNVSISVDADANLPEILVDEARMMQVFGNLLSNALRYTPPEGRIVLAARGIDSKLEMTVQDNGSGILPGDLPFIFDRFHRGDKSRHAEGGESGLGLAIVKALVESQGGQVSAESTPNAGTTIRLLFPV
jgi:signal transduction histidine kinase